MSYFCPDFGGHTGRLNWLYVDMTTDWPEDPAAMLVAWQRLESVVVHSSPAFDVRSDLVIRPDGERDRVVYAVSPGSVTVLAVDGDGAVLLTRQWVYVHSGTEWRLPGGPAPHGTTDYAAVASQVLAADTGLYAERWRSLGVLHGADNVCAHADHVFLATGLTAGPPAPGQQVRRLSLADAVGLVLTGQLRHAGSSHALLMTALTGNAQNRH